MITRNFYLFLILLAIATGCKKILHNPETIDPIYLDFVSESEKIKKEAEAKEKELDGYREGLAAAPEIGPDKKTLRDNVYKAEGDLAKLRQKQKYYELSASSRQIYVRKEYLEFYKNNKAWDPKSSADAYFKNKELQSEPKRWSRGDKVNLDPKKQENKENKKKAE